MNQEDTLAQESVRMPMEMLVEDAVKTNEVDDDDFDDVISTAIRDGTKEFALVAVVAACTCMASISALLILQYVPPTQSATEVAPDQCSANPNLPLWADLMDKQIQIIQNLVHASLLGGAGFVAAYRGDAVWLFFARNCCFYFGLAAISYFALDLSKQRFETSFIMSALLGSCCIAACIRLELVRYEVKRLVARHAGGHEGSDYPKYLPSTQLQLVATTLISRLSDGLQIVAIIYVALTTLAAMQDEDCDSFTKVGLLEASYREGAHQAFLLSLLFLISTFPGDQSCVGGAIFCSGWRTVLAVTYLFPILLTTTQFGTREILSLVATTVELSLTAPILISAILLFRENNASTSRTRSSKRSSDVKYSRLDEDKDEDAYDDEVTEEGNGGANRRIQSLSMYQIAKSSNFSRRQKYGAFIMWMSSACLLVGMTLECLLLLTIYNSNEVYQWGMHVCAMYLFCTHMSVTSPEVYSRGRWLLAIACPAGSVVAGWQLWVIFSSDGPQDMWSFAASLLFVWRALCGIGQSVGIGLLQTTNMEIAAIPELVASPELSTRQSRANFVLFKIYIPIIFLNILWEAYSYSCSEPLLSPTTPECVQNFFLLAKSWPALGTFFHFGGLLVIFASDSMCTTGAYPPSLIVSTLFSLHVAFLLVGDLVWDLVMMADDSPVQKLLLQLLWAMAAGWLGISLHRIWQWRIAEVQ